MKKAFILLTVISSPLYPMSVNAGYVVSYNADINTHKYINCGTLMAMNSVNIRAVTVSGSGSIQGKTVIIQCEEFGFNGTISCDATCTIYAKKAFDVNMFKKQGKGSFTVVISPYNFEQCSQDGLIAQMTSAFNEKCLKLSENAIDDMIKKSRVNAALNMLDERIVLEGIKQRMEHIADFHKEHLNQARDTSALYSGLAKLGSGAIGCIVAYMIFKHNDDLSQRFKSDIAQVNITAGIAGVASMAIAATSRHDFFAWLNPQHKEKHESILSIINRIDNALATPRVPEEQIINL